MAARAFRKFLFLIAISTGIEFPHALSMSIVITTSARSNSGGKERGGGTVDRAVTAARDLVQRAERQAFAGES